MSQHFTPPLMTFTMGNSTKKANTMAVADTLSKRVALSTKASSLTVRSQAMADSYTNPLETSTL